MLLVVYPGTLTILLNNSCTRMDWERSHQFCGVPPSAAVRPSRAAKLMRSLSVTKVENIPVPLTIKNLFNISRPYRAYYFLPARYRGVGVGSSASLGIGFAAIWPRPAYPPGVGRFPDGRPPFRHSPGP